MLKKRARGKPKYQIEGELIKRFRYEKQQRSIISSARSIKMQSYVKPKFRIVNYNTAVEYGRIMDEWINFI